ncbi:MAG: FAD-dependent oxidoreductase [Saprospiraceae bacterium]|nr:FAD-dependent oxidoreductase [Saprospiraceae bacterium]
MPVTWYDSIVTKIEDASPTVRRFWLDVPAADKPAFKAGQFITIDLPIGDKRLQRWRSYSIANAPHEDAGALELCIVKAPNGLGSQYLFEEVQPGSSLRWKGPEGAFFLPDTLEKDLVLVCTGTGVAPFRSMIRDLLGSGKAHRRVHLIFGTRREADILYRQEFEDLAKSWPGFRYDVVLSQEAGWPGYRGHVHQVYLAEYAEKRDDVAFYLCGWSNMIDEAVANLLVQLGYDRSQIHYELYG